MDTKYLSIYLFLFNLFHQCFIVFQYTGLSLPHLSLFLSILFFDTVINRIIPLISFLYSWCVEITDFHILILHLAILMNLLVLTAFG